MSMNFKLLLILAIVLMSGSAMAYDFGNSSYGTLRRCCEDTIRYSPFTCDSAGTVDSIRICVLNYGNTRSWKTMILDSTRSPITNGVSNAEFISSSPSSTWHTFTFSTNPSVEEATKYYLGAWCNDGNTYADVYCRESGDIANDTTYYDIQECDLSCTVPDPVSNDGNITAEMAIVAYVTVSSGATGQVIMITGD